MIFIQGVPLNMIAKRRLYLSDNVQSGSSHVLGEDSGPLEIATAVTSINISIALSNKR